MVVVKENAGGEIAQVPAGTYQAVCSAVWDIGRQKQEYNGEVKYPHQIIVRFEINKTIKDGEYAGKRYTLNKFYTASLHEKSSLRKDLQSWRGKEFTKEELAGFELDNVIGANCLLGVIHNDKGKAKIASISPIIDGMGKITAELDRTVPEWVQKFIDKAITDEPKQAPEPVDADTDAVPF